MSEERRRHCRITFDSAAHILVDDAEFSVEVLDLSLKGALLGIPEDAMLAVGAACFLRLTLDEDGDQICMECTVVHCATGRAGLASTAIDVDSITHLRRLVELNLGDDDLLQRELSALVGD